MSKFLGTPELQVLTYAEHNINDNLLSLILDLLWLYPLKILPLFFPFLRRHDIAIQVSRNAWVLVATAP